MRYGFFFYFLFLKIMRYGIWILYCAIFFWPNHTSENTNDLLRFVQKKLPLVWCMCAINRIHKTDSKNLGFFFIYIKKVNSSCNLLWHILITCIVISKWQWPICIFCYFNAFQKICNHLFAIIYTYPSKKNLGLWCMYFWD